MITATPIREVPTAQLLRGVGRASAVVLFCAWLGFFLAEVVQGKFKDPSVNEFFQAAALAIVFAGYAIGWRHELAGGLVAILGTAGFFVVYAFNLLHVTGIGNAMLFALPGVLYLLAWNLDRQRAKHIRG
jgi:hypothetical protein